MRAQRQFSQVAFGRSLALATGVVLALASTTSLVAAQGRGNDAIRAEDRFNALERQNAVLMGQVEQLQFKVQQLQQQIERMQTDYEFRIAQLEGRAGGQRPGAPAPRAAAPPPGPNVVAPPAPGNTLPPAPASSPPAAAASGGPPGTLPAGGQTAAVPAGAQGAEQLYEIGFNQMNERDYGAAERSFRSFLQAHPRHQLAGNAQFWIGEIYFVRKDYVNASIAYAEGYRNYPKSPKGAENLLQLGRSLALANQVREACTIWDKLGREYPNAANLIRERATQERQRYRCT